MEDIQYIIITNPDNLSPFLVQGMRKVIKLGVHQIHRGKQPKTSMRLIDENIVAT